MAHVADRPSSGAVSDVTVPIQAPTSLNSRLQGSAAKFQPAGADAGQDGEGWPDAQAFWGGS